MILRVGRIKEFITGIDTFIAEIGETRHIESVKKAGANVTIPSELVCERFLSKFVYGRGRVSDTLIGFLSLNQKASLETRRLTSTDPYTGMQFQQAIRAKCNNFILIGWHPKNSDELSTTQIDFSYHFVTGLSSHYSNKKLSEGDLIVGISLYG